MKYEDFCSEYGAGDGHDPRYDREKSKPAERKAAQLCSQVARTLSQCLAGMKDARLHNLEVVSVTPAPHTGRLLVELTGTDGTEEVLSAIDGVKGYLRTQVAQEITRRKAPELTWRYLEKA